MELLNEAVKETKNSGEFAVLSTINKDGGELKAYPTFRNRR